MIAPVGFLKSSLRAHLAKKQHAEAAGAIQGLVNHPSASADDLRAALSACAECFLELAAAQAAEAEDRLRAQHTPSWALLAGPYTWPIALDEWASGKRDKLADLVAGPFPIPREARRPLSEIVSGARKPDARGEHRKRTTHGRKQLAILRAEDIRRQLEEYESKATELAEATRPAREVSEVLRDLRKHYETALGKVAADAGVKTSVLKKWMKPSNKDSAPSPEPFSGNDADPLEWANPRD